MRLSILDDYQGVALTMADWSPLVGRVEIVVERKPFADEDAAARCLPMLARHLALIGHSQISCWGLGSGRRRPPPTLWLSSLPLSTHDNVLYQT